MAASHDAGALVFEIGVNSVNSFSFGTGLGSSVCPLTGGLSSNITVPAVTGNYSNGNAEFWLFLYSNSTVPSESAVAVVGSSTYFLGTVAGALCVATLPFNKLPASPTSSSSVASTLSAPAAAFTSTHGSADAVYALFENNTSTSPTWIVVYTPCGYDQTTHLATGGMDQQTFLGEVNGSTGAFVVGETDPSVNCSSLNSLLHSYALGMSEVASSGGPSSFYVDLALAPTVGLTTSDFGLRVANATSVLIGTATVPVGCAYGGAISSCTAGTGWYAVLLSATNTVLATYGNATPAWGNLAASTTNVTVTSSMTLVIVTNVVYSGHGYTLSAVETYIYPVSGSIVL